MDNTTYIVYIFPAPFLFSYINLFSPTARNKSICNSLTKYRLHVPKYDDVSHLPTAGIHYVNNRPCGFARDSVLNAPKLRAKANAKFQLFTAVKCKFSRVPSSFKHFVQLICSHNTLNSLWGFQLSVLKSILGLRSEDYANISQVNSMVSEEYFIDGWWVDTGVWRALASISRQLFTRFFLGLR